MRCAKVICIHFTIGDTYGDLGTSIFEKTRPERQELRYEFDLFVGSIDRDRIEYSSVLAYILKEPLS